MARHRSHIRGVDNCNVLVMQHLPFPLGRDKADKMLDNIAQSKTKDAN
jgi:hypothetical protein